MLARNILKEPLIYLSFRRRPESSGLNYMDSGLRRKDGVCINQMLLKAMFIMLCTIVMYGCNFSPIVIPPSDGSKAAWNLATLEQISKNARAGDWLVARGYKMTDHLVTAATLTPWSHVVVYDATRSEVIEAEAQGVHASSLQDFVMKSQHILLVRPKWQNDRSGPAAVEFAREKIGRGYDFLGTVGLQNTDRYYCSELAISAYADHIDSADKIPIIIKPSEMQRWGEIIFDSGGFK